MITKHNIFFRFSCKSGESREQKFLVRRMKLVEGLEIEGGRDVVEFVRLKLSPVSFRKPIDYWCCLIY